MSLASRHLGPIEIEGGPGGGRMDTALSFEGRSVPFRLEIDFPEKLDEGVVETIDMALDSMPMLDGMARDTIAAGLGIDTSAPSQLLRAQHGLEAAEFLDRLEPVQINMLPDGGRSSSERVVMVYQLKDSSSTGKITVRFREPIGPELDAAPRAGY